MQRRILLNGIVAAAVWVAILGVVPHAAAQADNTARARALFEQGVNAADQGNYTQAASLFRQTLALHSAPAVKFNLALAVERLGHHGEAVDLLEDVRDAHDAPASMRAQARHMLHRLEPEVGHLTVSFAGDLHGAEIVVDGRPIPAEKVGQPVAVDPGQRVVAIRRGDRTLGSQSVQVEAGGHATLTLHGQVPTAAQTAEAAETPENPEAPEGAVEPTDHGSGGHSIFKTWWFWTAVGVVAVGTATAVIVASSHGAPPPVQGNLTPGVVEVQP